MARLLLVRHGQASFGAEDYDVLSETGWDQGRVLGRYLADTGLTPEVIVHGGMRRHRETAQAMQEGASWSAADEHVEAGWSEFDHLSVVAQLPGLDRDEISDNRAFQKVFEQATARWITGEHDSDYAESFPMFVARVHEAMTRTLGQLGSGQTGVVVTSGGPIGVAAALLLGQATYSLSGELWQRLNAVIVNTSVAQVISGGSGPRLLTFNEHTHLERSLVTYR